MVKRLEVSRDELAKVLGNDWRLIRQFETLFQIADEASGGGADSLETIAAAIQGLANLGIALAEKDGMQVATVVQSDDSPRSVVPIQLDDPMRIAQVPSQDFDSIQINNVPTEQSNGKIRIRTNNGSLGYAINGVEYGICLDSVVYAVDATGGGFGAMTPLAVSGASGGNPAVYPTINTNQDRVIGLAVQVFGGSAAGYVMCLGTLRGVDASGGAYGESWAAGDKLYVGGSTGSLTKTAPVAPRHEIPVGVVVVASNPGTIFVCPQLPVSLNSLGDVQAIPTVMSQVLMWDITAGIWKQGTITAGTGISVANAAGTATINMSDVTNNQNTRLIKSSVTMLNGAGAAAGTLTNAPTAGNPTKWVPFDDNGTTRYFPSWT